MYILLILSFCSIFSGPILLHFAVKKKISLKFLDSFVLFSVVGLIIFHILPEAYQEIKLFALFFFLIGFLGPVLYEKIKKKKTSHIHKSFISIAFCGLIAHSMLDGLALFNAGNLNNSSGKAILGLAVVLHRMPEGVAIWNFTMKQNNKIFAFIIIFTVIVSTLIGFFFGNQFIHHVSEEILMFFQAFMSGALLHIIFHSENCKIFMKKPYNFFNWSKSSIFGALSGILVVVLITALEPIFYAN